MFLGLDMGGTHTDAVLLDQGKILKQIKIPTSSDFFISIEEALSKLIEGIDPLQIERINLSTTASTNAIVEGKIDEVGLILEPGPGLNPSFLKIGKANYILSSAIDHRGRETKALSAKELEEALDLIQKEKTEKLAVVGKFSPRNPEHELKTEEFFAPFFKDITLGHRLFGSLNFPRRVFTSYFNAAIERTYRTFVEAVFTFYNRHALQAPLYVLKADGGTLLLKLSAKIPVETILSGPAASIMGTVALVPTSNDAVILDIGGTTTDIAFLAEGSPLLEPKGAEIAGFPTLVRALYARPLGAAGDSFTHLEDGEIKIGPQRLGPAFALGGPAPTPTDALIFLGKLDLGSQEKAKEAMEILAAELEQDVNEAAEAILKKLSLKIAQRVEEELRIINSRPVYTVREFLKGKKVKPEEVIVIGGPALALASFLEEAFGIKVIAPPHADIANAIGAALSRVTAEVNLYADTEKGLLSVPEMGLTEKISRNFSLAEAKEKALLLLRDRARQLGATLNNLETEIIEEESFNMVRGFYTTGKMIKVRAQIKPGLVEDFKGDGFIA